MTAGSSVFTVSLPPLMSGLLVKVGLHNTLRMMSVFMFVLILAGLTYKPLLPKPVSSKSGERCSAIRRVFNVQIWRSLGYRIWAFGIPAALYGYFVPYVHLVSFMFCVHTHTLPLINTIFGLRPVGSGRDGDTSRT